MIRVVQYLQCLVRFQESVLDPALVPLMRTLKEVQSQKSVFQQEDDLQKLRQRLHKEAQALEEGMTTRNMWVLATSAVAMIAFLPVVYVAAIPGMLFVGAVALAGGASLASQVSNSVAIQQCRDVIESKINVTFTRVITVEAPLQGNAAQSFNERAERADKDYDALARRVLPEMMPLSKQ